MTHPWVEAQGGSQYCMMSPVACAAFKPGEISLSGPTVLSGLSLLRGHPGTSVPWADVLDRRPGQHLICYCDAAGLAAAPGAVSPPTTEVPFGVLEAAATTELTPDGPKKTPSYFCFMLPAGANLAELGFAVIFDNKAVVDPSTKTVTLALGHFSLVRYETTASVTRCNVSHTGELSRDPGTAAAPVGMAEVYQNHRGGLYFAAPILASYFNLHCFLVRGRADFLEFDPDEPGADADVADAIGWCVDNTSEVDDSLSGLLVECKKARSLARMDIELQSELIDVFKGVLAQQAAAVTVLRGLERLLELRSNALGTVLSAPPQATP